MATQTDKARAAGDRVTKRMADQSRQNGKHPDMRGIEKKVRELQTKSDRDRKR